MYSKYEVRCLIAYNKEQYNSTRDYEYMIKSAIYTGIYKALDGQKSTQLLNTTNDLVYGTYVVTKYIIKLNKLKNSMNAFKFLYNALLKYHMSPDKILQNSIPYSNSELADIVTNIACQNVENRLILNKDKVYSAVIEILSEINTKEISMSIKNTNEQGKYQ